MYIKNSDYREYFFKVSAMQNIDIYRKFCFECLTSHKNSLQHSE